MSAPDPRNHTLLTSPSPTARWSKSSRSANNGACVEVAFTPVVVAARDSKDPTGPALLFDRSAWTAFVSAVKNGDHDHR